MTADGIVQAVISGDAGELGELIARCGPRRNAAPLDIAERRGHDEIAELLREAGAGR